MVGWVICGNHVISAEHGSLLVIIINILMLDRPIFALDFRRRRAREGPLGGTGGVIMSIYGEPDLFRGRKIPAAPDLEHEISLDSIENPVNRKPPLLIRRRIMLPLDHW